MREDINELLASIPPVVWETDDRPHKTFKFYRIYDTFFVDMPGIGRIQVFNDWVFGEYWAKRKDVA